MYNLAVFIPITTASIRITGQKYYSQVIVAVTNSDAVSTKEAELDALLQKELKVIDPNSLPYRIQNQAEMLESITEIIGTLMLFLS
jgi:ABC-type antimicrobial peptide transport system permease subunit